MEVLESRFQEIFLGVPIAIGIAYKKTIPTTLLSLWGFYILLFKSLAEAMKQEPTRLEFEWLSPNHAALNPKHYG